MKKSIVVTGLGVASALGSSVEEFWQNLLAGKSGFRLVEDLNLPQKGCRIAAEVLEPPRRKLDAVNPQPRAVELALFAARQAWTDAAFDETEIDNERVGVVVGTGIGNQDLAELSIEKLQAGERLSPLTAFRSFAHSAACEILREFDLRGAVQTVSSGCNSGADAIGLALDWIRLGRCDAVLVGGTEAEINASFYGAMTAARALTTKFNDNPTVASRPFDAKRDGNAPGEGAGFLILESMEHAERRKAKIRAKVLGFANCAAGTRPAYDPFNPIFDTAPMLRTMQTALKDAGIYGDRNFRRQRQRFEQRFLRPARSQSDLRTFRRKIRQKFPFIRSKARSVKPELLLPLFKRLPPFYQSKTMILPPTINSENKDARCQINLVVNDPLEFPLHSILCNAIGFGGFYYASTIFGA